MNLTHLGQSQDSGTRILGDSNQGTPRYEAARGRANHAGLTRAERVQFGHGTPEDRAAVAAQNQQHREWVASEAGQAWLRTQTWYKGTA